MSRRSRTVPIAASSGALEDSVRQAPNSQASGHREEVHGNKAPGPNYAKHRRVISASDVSQMKRLRDGPVVEAQPIPELALDAPPLHDLDETERRTLQSQWADALKQVQSLRHSHTQIHRPKSFSGSRPFPKSLDHWNYYPGPSVTRPEVAGISTTLGTHGRAQVVDQVTLGACLDGGGRQFGRVQRTQSHRYGRGWGPNLGEAGGACEAVPGSPRQLKKAVSMREGGAHADAVREMARAYTDTVGGAPVTLECASCGRSLGVVVQGNPGVDTAFCHACRPSALQWKRSKKKTSGFMRFCRKILRLEKK